MANHRPAVPAPMKRILVEQAGGKCANPGCSNKLVELHHIHEWHIYQTHDEEHMIALCPACHDSVDRGFLQISDDELYRWKGIPRSPATSTGHIYVEPGDSPRLLIGSMVARGESGLILFDFSGRHRLSFAVRDHDIMLLNLRLTGPDGTPLIDVVDNYVKQREPSIELRTRPGAIEVPSGGITSTYIPEWARNALLQESNLYSGLPLPLLSLRVVDRGLVRVGGLWLDNDRGVVISPIGISFLDRNRPRPVTLVGDGEATVLNFVGAFDLPAFVFPPGQVDSEQPSL